MKKNEKIVEVSEEELKNGCQKKVYIDGEFVEVVIPKNSENKSRIAVMVEDKNGKKKKYIIILSLLATPIMTSSEAVSNEEFGMKARKKGMKYQSINKKGFPKGLIVGGGLGIVAVGVATLFLFNNNSKVNNLVNKKQKVVCDYTFNENYDNKWVPSQQFHYEFLFKEGGNEIEKIQISSNYKYNRGTLEERKVYNGNTYSVIPGGTDAEIKSTYFSNCDTCTIKDGVVTDIFDEDVKEFFDYSNLRDDSSKTLKENLVDTFNITSSCEEGYYFYIPYIDTQAEYCPIENFKSHCTIEDVE